MRLYTANPNINGNFPISSLVRRIIICEFAPDVFVILLCVCVSLYSDTFHHESARMKRRWRETAAFFLFSLIFCGFWRQMVWMLRGFGGFEIIIVIWPNLYSGFIRSGFIPSTSTCLEAIYGSRSGIFDRNIDFSPNRLCSSPLRGWLQIMNFNLENYWKNSKNSLHAVNIEKGHWKARTLSKYLEEAVEIYANHKRMYKK